MRCSHFCWNGRQIVPLNRCWRAGMPAFTAGGGRAAVVGMMASVEPGPARAGGSCEQVPKGLIFLSSLLNRFWRAGMPACSAASAQQAVRQGKVRRAKAMQHLGCQQSTE